jgi:hypothetical protein
MNEISSFIKLYFNTEKQNYTKTLYCAHLFYAFFGLKFTHFLNLRHLIFGLTLSIFIHLRYFFLIGI